MKKLLLLSTFLIFACSNDNDSNQTFLERFDRVVWENTEYDGWELKRFKFTNDPKSIKSYKETEYGYSCSVDCINNNTDCYTIYENSYNKLTIGNDQFLSTFTISEDGQFLTDNSDDNILFTRTNLLELCDQCNCD